MSTAVFKRPRPPARCQPQAIPTIAFGCHDPRSGTNSAKRASQRTTDECNANGQAQPQQAQMP